MTWMLVMMSTVCATSGAPPTAIMSCQPKVAYVVRGYESLDACNRAKIGEWLCLPGPKRETLSCTYGADFPCQKLDR